MRTKQPITPANDPVARGQRIRMARKFANLTARALGVAIGYSNSSLSNHESGIRPLNNKIILQKISEATHVNFTWLQSGCGDPIDDPEQRQAFYKKSGTILIHSTVAPFNTQAFLQLYDELRTITYGKGFTDREVTVLSAKAYACLSCSNLSEEDLRQLIPGAAQLAFRFRQEEQPQSNHSHS